jgi:hypothetical protein
LRDPEHRQRALALMDVDAEFAGLSVHSIAPTYSEYTYIDRQHQTTRVFIPKPLQDGSGHVSGRMPMLPTVMIVTLDGSRDTLEDIGGLCTPIRPRVLWSGWMMAATRGGGRAKKEDFLI